MEVSGWCWHLARALEAELSGWCWRLAGALEAELSGWCLSLAGALEAALLVVVGLSRWLTLDCGVLMVHGDLVEYGDWGG